MSAEQSKPPVMRRLTKARMSRPSMMASWLGSPGVRGVTVMVTLAQAALVQPVVGLLARAKYWVVVAGVTVGIAPAGAGVPPPLAVEQVTGSPGAIGCG